MTAATVRAFHVGAGASPAVGTPMAGDLEVPRPLRLVLTAGWNLAESAGLPVAAYAVAAWAGRPQRGPDRWARGHLAYGGHPQGRDRICAEPADDFRGGAHGAGRGGARYRRAVAIPAAVPAREPVHVRAVRTDGERPGPARRAAGRRGGRAEAAARPSPGPAPFLPGGNLAVGGNLPAARGRPGSPDGHRAGRDIPDALDRRYRRARRRRNRRVRAVVLLGPAQARPPALFRAA